MWGLLPESALLSIKEQVDLNCLGAFGTDDTVEGIASQVQSSLLVVVLAVDGGQSRSKGISGKEVKLST